jgi:hypothetical protein
MNAHAKFNVGGNVGPSCVGHHCLGVEDIWPKGGPR